MDRKTFIRQLERLLVDWPDAQEREEQILYYEEMLVDLTEEQAAQRVEQLGGPQKVAEELRRAKGLPPQPLTDPGWQPGASQEGDWEQPAGQADGSENDQFRQHLSETKMKNRRRGRVVVTAAILAVVLLAAAAGGAVWLLSRRAEPAGSGSSGSSSLPSSSTSVPAAGDSSAADSGVDSASGQPGADSGSSGSSASSASGLTESLPVSGQLPEGVEQAAGLVVNASGVNLTVKGGDAWNLAAGANSSMQSSLEGNQLELQLDAGAFVLTVPAGVTDIEITADKGRLDLRQLESGNVELDIANADLELEEITADSLSVALRQGNLQAGSLLLSQKLGLQLEQGSAQVVLAQPESYGYTVECQQGSLVLDTNSWNGEAQPQQAQQAGEGLQFEINVKQGSSSITFEPTQQA